MKVRLTLAFSPAGPSLSNVCPIGISFSFVIGPLIIFTFILSEPMKVMVKVQPSFVAIPRFIIPIPKNCEV